MSRREHLESELLRQTEESFSRHQLISAEETKGGVRWYARRDGDSAFWVEVVALRGGALLAHGDIDPVIFARGPADPYARLAWLGDRPLGAYAVEKATIGMNGRETLEQWDAEVAKQDVLDLADHLRENGVEPSEVEKMVAVSRDITCETTREEVCREVYDLGSWEDLDLLGMVKSVRLVHAHTALRRVYQLAVEKEPSRWK